jgi:hypothetical protein
LGLCTYYTAGVKETRAWTIHKGTKAPQAAGVIHSDFERGFICAECYKSDDLIRLGSEQKIDASYLGAQVNLSMFLEEHTKEYGVPLLMSGELYDLLSPTVQVRCRWLDSLSVANTTPSTARTN